MNEEQKVNKEELICKNCGTRNTSSDRHCQSCGSPLATAALVDVTTVSQRKRSPKGSPSSRLPVITILGRGFNGTKTGKRWFIPLSIFMAIIILLSIFLIVNRFIPPTPIMPTGVGPDGIGVELVDGEYIGISDGRYPLDIHRPSGSLKLQASEALRKGNTGKAFAQWGAAHDEDTNDAEPLIYAENQRVKTFGTYITVVLGIALNVKKDEGFSRDTLQAAYIVQKECNENPQLSGGKKLRLLIANSGSNSDHSKDIATQIVKAAQYDKTIVGVQGWTTSQTTLNAIETLVQAHLPIVASDTASNQLTGMSPYFFRVGTPGKLNVPLITTYVEKKLKFQRMVIFKDPAEPYSTERAGDLVQQFEKDGFKDHIAPIEEFQTGDKDKQLTQQVQKVLTKYKPDLIFMTTTAVDDIRTLLDAIPTTPEYTNLNVFAGGAGYELVQTEEKVKGYTRMLLSSSAYPDEGGILVQGYQNPPFFKDYIAAYDPHDEHKDHPYRFRRANGTVMMHYDALSTFLQASKMAVQQGKQNPTPEDVKNALSQINGTQSFQGITGAIVFGADGDPINKVRLILHVVDGGYTRVAAYQGCFLVGATCDDSIKILE